MTSERNSCSVGRAERSDGRNAKGQSAMALKTTWPTKRSQVTSETGTSLTATRYFAEASSAAKQRVASAMSPIAFRRWRGSVRADGGGRGVMSGDYLHESPADDHKIEAAGSRTEATANGGEHG